MAFGSKFVFKCLSCLYPPLCLHCHTRLKEHGPLFCPLCLEHLCLLEPQGRCATCCSELSKKGCARCKARTTVLSTQIAAVEAVGPGKTLLRALSTADTKPLAAAASLMTYQWLRLEKPLPDQVIALPLSWNKKLFVERDAHRALAEEVAALFHIPCVHALHVHYNHAAFMRGKTLESTFTLSPRHMQTCIDKRVLLVTPFLDDVILRLAAMALQMGYPAQIEALALALSDEEGAHSSGR